MKIVTCVNASINHGYGAPVTARFVTTTVLHPLAYAEAIKESIHSGSMPKPEVWI